MRAAAAMRMRTVAARHLLADAAGFRHPVRAVPALQHRFCQSVSTDVVGIDLGTTNSCVAVMGADNSVRVCENSEGSRTTPSVVAVDKHGHILVGGPARRQAVTNPRNTFYAVKRLIGRRSADKTIDRARESVPYKISAAPNGDAWVEDQNGTQYSPSEIGAKVLMKMKETAESYIGKKVQRAVVTVPAYFNDQQRQATQDAGRIAGFKVERIINEPTAAALSYGMDKEGDNQIAVFDLGGGTFDISVLEIKGGVFEVRATNGDTFLGGEDVDEALLARFVEVFKEKEGINLTSNVVAVQRLREASEKAKKDLDHTESAEIECPYITVQDGVPKHFQYNLTRAEFESLIDPLIKRIADPCKICMRDAGLKTSDITQVVMVGGMTRTPKVIDTVKRMFKQEPHRGVNPDEVVAMGAAIQGSIIAGKTSGLILVDVTPLSLGTEIVGGLFSRIIKKNSRIPCKMSGSYTTNDDNQQSITVKVLQGEREVAAANKLLGEFTLDGLPPLPKGVPQIEITFEIDVNGLIHVTALDKGTNRQRQTKVQSRGGLSDEEIERMIKDAEDHKEKDEARRKVLEERNMCEQQIRGANDFMEKVEGKTEIKEKLRAAVAELETALQNDQIELETLLEKKAAVTELTGKLYSAA
eukprot:TRINITY_DN4595_c1_g1_i1.p2 TRINITY_DN4595_c1_g1~~TRINITY_DN4595_c1_g1_i1.p2  ORF type:complete len:642 (+),score=274.34 TRINITY_DN4595_c1_g1_i1:74-1999(+)